MYSCSSTYASLSLYEPSKLVSIQFTYSFFCTIDHNLTGGPNAQLPNALTRSLTVHIFIYYRTHNEKNRIN